MNRLDKLLEWGLIFLMALMVVDVTWQIITRFILRDPSSYTEELAKFLLIWIGLLGGSYTHGIKGHLGIDVLTRTLNPVTGKRVQVIVQSLIVVFAVCVLIIGGLNLVFITLHLNQISSALQIKIGYVYLVLPLSGFFFTYYSIRHILQIMHLSKTE